MRLAWVLALVVASGCLVEVDYGGTRFACAVSPVCPPGFECVNDVCMPASSAFRRRLAISDAAGGAASDVAVRVPLTLDRIDYRQVAEGGSDLRFIDDEGGSLAHVIESWNPGGESIVWVRLPALETGATFSMIYGDGVPGGERPDQVWSAPPVEALVTFGELEEL